MPVGDVLGLASGIDCLEIDMLRWYSRRLARSVRLGARTRNTTVRSVKKNFSYPGRAGVLRPEPERVVRRAVKAG